MCWHDVCVCVCVLCVCEALAVSVFTLWKTSRNQLQLFSVDNVIKLKAAANTPALIWNGRGFTSGGSAACIASERPRVGRCVSRCNHTDPSGETASNLLSCREISAG